MRRLATVHNLLILIIISFFILTILVKYYDYFNFDLAITLFIQNFHHSWFEFLMKAVSFVGQVSIGSLVILLVGSVFIYLKKYKATFVLILSSYGSVILGKLLKDLISRPRPSAKLIHQIGLYPKSDSFPSGHVLFAIGLYGFLFFLVSTQIKNNMRLKKTLLILLCLPLTLMGLSRIYLGAHWFSDVLGAYLLGYIWLFITIHLYHKAFR